MIMSVCGLENKTGVIPVLILPNFIGLDGVWASIPVGEFMALVMGVYYFRKLKL